MDAATLQARIYSGYAKAALRIGQTADQHRATSATNPMAAGTKLRAIMASFNAEDAGYKKPNKYGHPTWFGIFDGSLTQPGDYLTGAFGTFFIAAQQLHLPILCVQCNAVVTIKRPQQQGGVGALGYGGNTDAGETALMTGWPASVLQGGGGDRSDVGLPGDTKNPQWSVLLPSYGVVALRSGDIITDDIGKRMVISSAEKTDLGWRIVAMQEQT